MTAAEFHVRDEAVAASFKAALYRVTAVETDDDGIVWFTLDGDDPTVLSAGALAQHLEWRAWLARREESSS